MFDMAKQYEPYIECRCLPRPFVEDINKVFDNYIQLKLDKYGFSKVTAEQIDTIETAIDYLPEETQTATRNYLIYTMEHPQEAKTLGFIRNYLEKCECPSGVNINYRDGFHSYKNIKNLLENIMGK